MASTTSIDSVARVEPRIIDAIYRGRGKGWLVHARFACGHEEEVAFPNAPARGTSKRDLKEWTFGHAAQEPLCVRCMRAES